MRKGKEKVGLGERCPFEAAREENAGVSDGGV